MQGKAEHQMVMLGLQGSVATILRNLGDSTRQQSQQQQQQSRSGSFRGTEGQDLLATVKECRWREDQLLQLVSSDCRISLPSLMQLNGLEIRMTPTVPEPNRSDGDEGGCLNRPSECVRGGFLPVVDNLEGEISNNDNNSLLVHDPCLSNQGMAALLLSASPPAFSVPYDLSHFEDRCVQECLPGACTVSAEAFYMFKWLAQELLKSVVEQSEKSRQLHKNDFLSKRNVYEAFKIINGNGHIYHPF